GGVTSYFDMPNTKPPTTSDELINEKIAIAKEHSLVNYGFFVGATNDNIDELLHLDYTKICGIKLFMGSSTGNMLVDNEKALRLLFKESPVNIAAHCESEAVVKAETERFKQLFPMDAHPRIHQHVRNARACYESTALAVALAKEYETRLHVCHISTKRELKLFSNKPLVNKRITAEACIPHLWFDADDYETLGIRIKCNPSIKTRADRNAIRYALADNIIDSVATDHAPHTWEEKNRPYFDAPSGMPSVQFGICVMMDLYYKRIFPLETIAQKMCHAPATIFKIKDRGYLREGYFADIAIIDPDAHWQIHDDTAISKCKWTPFDKLWFGTRVAATMVNGKFVYRNNKIVEGQGAAMQVAFNRV
ncbi:MAG: amidohydrolase family protein, partial [Bacteroidales bacterium]|nr:amidohydrolase family protein [Bacteroidales bacterium]